MLDFTFEKGAKFYQVFQMVEICADPGANKKHIPRIISSMYCQNTKCKESVGNKIEGVVWIKHFECQTEMCRFKL